MMNATNVKQLLNLSPLPMEGGFFREIYGFIIPVPRQLRSCFSRMAAGKKGLSDLISLPAKYLKVLSPEEPGRLPSSTTSLPEAGDYSGQW